MSARSIETTVRFYFKEPLEKTVSEASKDYSNSPMTIEFKDGEILPLDFDVLGGRRGEVVKAVATSVELPEIKLLLALVDSHPVHSGPTESFGHPPWCSRCHALELLASAARRAVSR